jgi:hypothetical protein
LRGCVAEHQGRLPASEIWNIQPDRFAAGRAPREGIFDRLPLTCFEKSVCRAMKPIIACDVVDTFTDVETGKGIRLLISRYFGDLGNGSTTDVVMCNQSYPGRTESISSAQ